MPKYSKILFLVVCFSLSACRDHQTLNAPNILLICVDDLRPELRSFGVEYISSPNIDQLAKGGISFHNHFVNAPSCGPSRYTLLTSMYGPSSNNALFLRAEKVKQGAKVNASMPEWFKANGYTTVSVGKVSHHPGGRGGQDWNDDGIIEMPGSWDKHLLPVGEWQHPRGVMHGLANGEIRIKAGDMDVFQSKDGSDEIYPDGLIADEAVKQLGDLTKGERPFFLAVGFLKPHLPFGAPKTYLDQYENIEFSAIEHPIKPEGRTTWHPSGEFMKYNRWERDPRIDVDFAEQVRRHYAACVSYADAQVGKVMNELRRTGADKNTIVVLWGDHGWHLGEHAIWGKHSLFEESLRSPLIIQYPGMANSGMRTEAVVETLDIFPTLCELAGLELPSYLQGESLTPYFENPKLRGREALAYTGNASTLRTETHRLILHKDGYVELYDLTSAEKETKNIANSYPDVIKKMTQTLTDKQTVN